MNVFPASAVPRQSLAEGIPRRDIKRWWWSEWWPLMKTSCRCCRFGVERSNSSQCPNQGFTCKFNSLSPSSCQDRGSLTLCLNWPLETIVLKQGPAAKGRWPIWILISWLEMSLFQWRPVVYAGFFSNLWISSWNTDKFRLFNFILFIEYICIWFLGRRQTANSLFSFGIFVKCDMNDKIVQLLHEIKATHCLSVGEGVSSACHGSISIFEQSSIGLWSCVNCLGQVEKLVFRFFVSVITRLGGKNMSFVWNSYFWHLLDF